ncbi:hypothetical protein BKA62DRAFT_658528 [Auriculariales sp. MPI-PUGE-AT-0066]|nr:hypothetical protein BKA62DRAFT_658528 [Auriculariales sp. MPI-PUGE-AT-0066]
MSGTNGRPARLNLVNARAPALGGVEGVEVDRSPTVPGAFLVTPDGDAVLEDLAQLEQLRLSVQANLKVRPIANAAIPGPVFGLGHRARNDSVSSISSDPSTPGSVYYTPIDHYTPNPLFSPRSANAFQTPPDSAAREPDTDADDGDDDNDTAGMHPRELFHSLELSHRRPLLLDMRPLQAFLQARIQDSVNLSIPSLILKRVRKPNGSFKNLDALRPFITTDSAREYWENLLKPGTDNWDGTVVLFDDDMDEREQSSPQVPPAWTLLQVIAPIVPNATYLRGGFNLVLSLPDLDHHIERGEPSATPTHPLAPRIAFTASTPLPPPSARSFALRTDVAQASNRMRTTIDHSFDGARSPSPLPLHTPPRTPRTPSSLRIDIPPPPASPPIAPAPARASTLRPRIPSLKGLSLDTSSLRPNPLGMGASHSAHPGAPRPKLSLKTSTEQLSAIPLARRVSSAMHPRGQFPGAPPSLLTGAAAPAPRVASDFGALPDDDDIPPPSGLEPLPGTFDWGAAARARQADGDSGSSSSSLSSPPSPNPPTARPSSALSTPDSSEMPQQFIVSCILPGFLFLGPEIATEGQVHEVESCGVKRILNIAAECEDDHGLGLRTRFEKYMHIPIRDTVEEENIAKGVQEVCKFLDDARLHSSPTYVHCKAGKSRSVTAVMAYLIHANHWPLSKAYSFVLERRKGISPNIGFVSELMTFEERELGSKSGGVNGAAMNAHGSSTSRPAHVRESLPPQTSDSAVPLYMQHASVDEELEVKDASGRYRHQRRAPVDERTLQPTRRVSKAGLESTWQWRESDAANAVDATDSVDADADAEDQDAVAQALNALERTIGPSASIETVTPGRPW